MTYLIPVGCKYMPWCFAIVNGRLAEIFFEKRGKEPHITGHCYVKREEYKTKQEQKWIDQDTKRMRFTYRKGKYKSIEQSQTLAVFSAM